MFRFRHRLGGQGIAEFGNTLRTQQWIDLHRPVDGAQQVIGITPAKGELCRFEVIALMAFEGIDRWQPLNTGTHGSADRIQIGPRAHDTCPEQDRSTVTRKRDPRETIRETGGRVARRIILCDGADLARLWGHIGTAEEEVLTWVPREDAPRARPQGFHSLQGGLTPDGILKLNPKVGDELALVDKTLEEDD